MFEWLMNILPVAATEAARSWDVLYWFLFIVTVGFFLICIIPLVVFIIRYRKRKGVQPTFIEHNYLLEVVWTAVPTLILMVIFAWGFIVYNELQDGAPSDSMQIKVVATSAWQWKFQYPDGKILQDELFVPVDTPVRLTITADPGTPGVKYSSSMLHSFFVPNFRIKKDAVPGLYDYTWFKADKIGQHIFFCAEYCGTQHSQMYGRIVVLSADDWKLWQWGKLSEEYIDALPWVGDGALADKWAKEKSFASREESSTMSASLGIKAESLVESGKHLSQSMGCQTCHSVDGSPKLAPSFQGLYQREVTLVDGSQVLADDNYIRESIIYPQRKIVKGYERLVMPPYPSRLSETDFSALVAYIQSLKVTTARSQ